MHAAYKPIQERKPNHTQVPMQSVNTPTQEPFHVICIAEIKTRPDPPSGGPQGDSSEGKDQVSYTSERSSTAKIVPGIDPQSWFP